MSKREFLIIVCIALALAIALPFMARSFMPRKAEPEPLPGVPFSTEEEKQKHRDVFFEPCTIVGEVDLQYIAHRERLEVSLLSSLGNQPGWHTEKSTKVLGDGTFELRVLAIDIGGSLQQTRFKVVAAYDAYETAERYVTPRPGLRITVGKLKLVPQCELTLRIKFLGTLARGEWEPARRIQLVRLDELDSLEGLRSWPYENYWATGRIKAVDVIPDRSMRVRFGRYSVQIDYTEPGLRFDRSAGPTLLPFEHVFDVDRPSLQVHVEERDPEGKCSLKAEVVDARGAVLANQKCKVDRIGPGPQVRPAYYGETDSRGMLNVSSLPSGCYSISTDWRVAARYVQLVEGQEVHHRLQFEKPGALCVRILQRGKPISGFHVKTTEGVSDWGPTRTTDESGLAWFSHLEFPCWVKPLVNGRSASRPGRLPCDRHIDRQPDPDSPTDIDIEPVDSVTLAGCVTFSGSGLSTGTGNGAIAAMACFGVDPHNQKHIADIAVDPSGNFKCVGLPRGRYAVRFSLGIKDNPAGSALDVIDLSGVSAEASTYRRNFPVRSFTVRLDALSKRLIDRLTLVRLIPKSLFDIGATDHSLSVEVENGVMELKNFPCDNYVLLANPLDLNGQTKTLTGVLSVNEATEGERTVLLEQRPKTEALAASWVTIELASSRASGPASLGAGLLSLYDSAKRLIAYHYMDRKGQRLEFVGLEPGAYSVEFVMNPRVRITQSFEIAAGRPAFVELAPQLPYVRCLVRVDGITNAAGLYGTVAELQRINAEGPPRQDVCIPVLVDGVPHLYVRSAEQGRAFRLILPDGSSKVLNVPANADTSGETWLAVSFSK